MKAFIPTERKLEWIDTLFEAGVVEMEVTSFVSPKAIPQLADAAEVLTETKRRHPTARLTALVPNTKGAERALACGADVYFDFLHTFCLRDRALQNLQYLHSTLCPS